VAKKPDSKEQTANGQVLIQGVKNLIDDQKHLDDIILALAELMDISKLSRFGCKVRAIQLMHEGYNAREAEISAKELLHG
jgi:hypothetical protein